MYSRNKSFLQKIECPEIQKLETQKSSPESWFSSLESTEVWVRVASFKLRPSYFLPLTGTATMNSANCMWLQVCLSLSVVFHYFCRWTLWLAHLENLMILSLLIKSASLKYVWQARYSSAKYSWKLVILVYKELHANYWIFSQPSDWQTAHVTSQALVYM